MLILAIDSSGMTASAALVTGEKVMAEMSVNNKKTHSQTLLPMIRDVFEAAGVQPEEIDVVLVPCVGFDVGLRRLGYGAGYYDRYLPRCRKALCIGVAFEVQRLELVVTGEHDRSLDRIVTEREIIKP